MRGDHYASLDVTNVLRSRSQSQRKGITALLAIRKRLARYMKNCIGLLGLLLQHLDRFGGGHDKQFDPVTQGLAFYFLHYGQSAVCTAADDELAAFPGNLFFHREGCVTELLAKFLRWLFLAFANFAAINDDIVFVHGAVDLNGAE